MNEGTEPGQIPTDNSDPMNDTILMELLWEIILSTLVLWIEFVSVMIIKLHSHDIIYPMTGQKILKISHLPDTLFYHTYLNWEYDETLSQKKAARTRVKAKSRY